MFHNGKEVWGKTPERRETAGIRRLFHFETDPVKHAMTGKWGAQVLDRPYFFILRHRVVRGRSRMRALSPIW